MTISELDSLALAPEKVELSNGKTVEVTGVQMAGLIYIGRKFPDIITGIFGGDKNDKGEVLVDNLWWTKLGKDHINAFIAAGCGKEGNEAAEQAAGSYAAFDQFKLMEAIIRRTMPQGLGPFVDMLSKMLTALNPNPSADQLPKIQIRRSRKQSSLSPNGGEETSSASGNLPHDRSLPI